MFSIFMDTGQYFDVNALALRRFLTHLVRKKRRLYRNEEWNKKSPTENASPVASGDLLSSAHCTESSPNGRAVYSFSAKKYPQTRSPSDAKRCLDRQLETASSNSYCENSFTKLFSDFCSVVNSSWRIWANSGVLSSAVILVNPASTRSCITENLQKKYKKQQRINTNSKLPSIDWLIWLILNTDSKLPLIDWLIWLILNTNSKLPLIDWLIWLFLNTNSKLPLIDWLIWLFLLIGSECPLIDWLKRKKW